MDVRVGSSDGHLDDDTLHRRTGLSISTPPSGGFPFAWGIPDCGFKNRAWPKLLTQTAGGDGRLTAHPRHSAYEGRGAEGLATGVTDPPDEGRIAGTGAGSAVGTTAGLAGWLEALVGVGTAAGGVVGNGTSQSCTVSAAARSIGLRQQTGTGSFGSRQQIAPHERQ